MSQVRNLRAMFEQRGESSPPERGRGTGTPQDSPQPLSRVRTSFITVAKDGRVGIQRDHSTDSSTSVQRRVSGVNEGETAITSSPAPSNKTTETGQEDKTEELAEFTVVAMETPAKAPASEPVASPEVAATPAAEAISTEPAPAEAAPEKLSAESAPEAPAAEAAAAEAEPPVPSEPAGPAEPASVETDVAETAPVEAEAEPTPAKAAPEEPTVGEVATEEATPQSTIEEPAAEQHTPAEPASVEPTAESTHSEATLVEPTPIIAVTPAVATEDSAGKEEGQPAAPSIPAESADAVLEEAQVSTPTKASDKEAEQVESGPAVDKSPLKPAPASLASPAKTPLKIAKNPIKGPQKSPLKSPRSPTISASGAAHRPAHAGSPKTTLPKASSSSTTKNPSKIAKASTGKHAPTTISTAKASEKPASRSPSVASKTPSTPGKSQIPKSSTETPEKSAPAAPGTDRGSTTTTTPKSATSSAAAKSSTSSAAKRPAPIQSFPPNGVGFVKPKPKSPTRPVQLPASLTTHTASSATKVNNARQSLSQSATRLPHPHQSTARPSSRVSVSTVGTSTTTGGTKNLKRQSSTISRPRPSVGPPPKPPAHDHPVTKREKPVDESFLARMMRPTQSSSSKTADKVPVAVSRARGPATTHRPAARNGHSATAKRPTGHLPAKKAATKTPAVTSASAEIEHLAHAPVANEIAEQPAEQPAELVQNVGYVEPTYDPTTGYFYAPAAAVDTNGETF